MEHAESLYYRMIGLYDLRADTPPEGAHVEDVFAPNGECASLLERIYYTRIRIADRLHASIEDADLMELVESYEALQEKLALNMYRYGKQGI